MSADRSAYQPPQPTVIGAARFFNHDQIPELTIDQYRGIMESVAQWLSLKAEHETRWTDEQRQCLRQLAPDIDHSSLLHRLVFRRKLPLPEPPPLQYAYPVYPDEDR